jgi:hypothetical protein
VQRLNPAAFGPAAASTLGTAGRNAFIGPGFYSFDRVGDADGSAIAWIGVATFGRQGFPPGFPAVIAFNETPRQI